MTAMTVRAAVAAMGAAGARWDRIGRDRERGCYAAHEHPFAYRGPRTEVRVAGHRRELPGGPSPGGEEPVRVLGVDPGLSRCGLGVVEGDLHRAVIVRAGVVQTDPGEPTAMRLAHLHAEITALVAELQPDAVAIERVFINANRSTAMGVGQAAGVALLAAAQGGIDAVEYTPSQVKAAVTGTGDAEKSQVGFMVKAILKLGDVPRPADVADALALGLCHLRQGAISTGAGGRGSGQGDSPSSQDATAGGMSPRLAAAVAEAGPGAQVTRRGTGDRREGPRATGDHREGTGATGEHRRSEP